MIVIEPMAVYIMIYNNSRWVLVYVLLGFYIILSNYVHIHVYTSDCHGLRHKFKHIVLFYISDFQKAAVFIKEFLLKLSEDTECAELRDALNLALLHMQRYYRTLRLRSQSGDRNQNLQNSTNQNLSGSMRGRSPLTPFKDTPDKFVWKWFNIDSPKVPGSLPVEGDKNLITLPLIIQAAKQGDLDLVEQLIDKGIYEMLTSLKNSD